MRILMTLAAAYVQLLMFFAACVTTGRKGCSKRYERPLFFILNALTLPLWILILIFGTPEKKLVNVVLFGAAVGYLFFVVATDLLTAVHNARPKYEKVPITGIILKTGTLSLVMTIIDVVIYLSENQII